MEARLFPPAFGQRSSTGVRGDPTDGGASPAPCLTRTLYLVVALMVAGDALCELLDRLGGVGSGADDFL